MNQMTIGDLFDFTCLLVASLSVGACIRMIIKNEKETPTLLPYLRKLLNKTTA